MKGSNLTGFKVVENNFEGKWRKIVDAWAAMNATYVSEFGDLPAWYVENSNTALLSAAAWKCGCPALCEPDVSKQRFTGRPGRPAEYVGRLDMEIHIDDSWTWIEAKKSHFQYTHKVDGRSDRRSRLVNLIDGARKSATNSSKAAKKFGWNVLAMGFFSASVTQDSLERRDDRSLRNGLGKEAAVERAITSENQAMIERLERYRIENDSSLRYAVYRNSSSRLQGWVDSDYPAAFGLISSCM
jgi:hypothetical protein